MICGIYCRVSTAGQAEKYSLSTQIQRGLEFSNKLGVDFEIYQDAVSGKSIEGRTRFEDLLTDIRAQKVDKVWVIEQSRLGRNVEDASFVKRVFQQYKIKLYVDGVLSELKTPEDSLQYNIKSSISEYEREQIISRTTRGKTAWQDAGNMAFPVVFGYSFTYDEKGKKQWYLVQEEKETVLLIFDCYVNKRMPLNQIKLILNDEGKKTKKGSIFNNSQVRAILSQIAYTGRIWNTENIPIKSNIYEGFLDTELWDLAQVELQRKRKPTNYFEQRPAKYELSGLIHCEKCGAPFHINEQIRQTKTKGIRTWFKYYHAKQTNAHKACTQDPKYANKENTELQVYNIIRNKFFENDVMLGKWYRLHTTEIQKDIDQLELETASLQERLEKEQSRKSALLEAIIEKVIDKVDARVKMVEIQDAITQLESRLKEKTHLVQIKKSEQGSDYNLSIVKLFKDFEQLDGRERRRLYQTVFKSITLNKNRLTLTFFDDSVEKMLVDNVRKK